MKLKYDFVINQVADQTVAVIVGDGMQEFNGFLKMNDIGAEILDLLKNEITMDQLVCEMCKKHPDSTEEEARETITEFVGKLEESGLLA